MKLSRCSPCFLKTPSFEPDLTKRGIKLTGYTTRSVSRSSDMGLQATELARGTAAW